MIGNALGTLLIFKLIDTATTYVRVGRTETNAAIHSIKLCN